MELVSTLLHTDFRKQVIDTSAQEVQVIFLCQLILRVRPLVLKQLLSIDTKINTDTLVTPSA
jgi:hypothetical protein